MSESNPEAWIAFATAALGTVTAVLGAMFGGKKREETAERVVGLSIAGGVYESGQRLLAQQAIDDALKVAREAVEAVKNLGAATSALTDSIEHFDETTEREARDHTRSRLDEITETLKKLDR